MIIGDAALLAGDGDLLLLLEEEDEGGGGDVGGITIELVSWITREITLNSEVTQTGSGTGGVMQFCQLDDVGVTIRVLLKENGAALDISSVTAKQIQLIAPSGTVKLKTAAFETDGSDGVLTYVTIADDLDERGTWLARPLITYSGGFNGRGNPAYFEVQ